MNTYADDPNDLKNVPTGMENDPEADEQIIDQTEGAPKSYPDALAPSGLERPQAGEETPMDDLANALAYAIDGGGTGLAGAPPVAPRVGDVQKIKTEGITGASEEDEAQNL